MNVTHLWEQLALKEGGKIVYLVLDGLGGIQNPESGLTELQTAKKPHLNALAKKSSCGLLDIIGAGVTPGSGPGHMALFGYNPLEYNIGRGIFSALGIGFDLQAGDIAARLNFCSVNEKGVIVDRRAGRLATKINEELCDKLRKNLKLDDVQFFIQTESEHRAVLVLRGKELEGNISDTDPSLTNHLPLEPKTSDKNSEKTLGLLKKFLSQSQKILKDEKPANMILLRGIEKYKPTQGLKERFLLDGLCIAEYPMYKGVSRFLSMNVVNSVGGIPGLIENFKAHYNDAHHFYFLHVKYTDKTGEDGDFKKKVAVIEEVDSYIPQILNLNPDVFIVTGDHSTPSVMKMHSWHPVPVLIKANNARIDQVDTFDEIACLSGALGMRPASDLMGLALAHAGRLKKFGA